MHLKRQEVPKSWPVSRKGTKYVVRPLSDMSAGVPILVIMRDILKTAQNRKEVKRAIHIKGILLNNKPVTDEKVSAMLFDTITIVPAKKSYRLELTENGKFDMMEIKENEANNKISKVVDKKMLKGKKVQLNLSDGNNFISDVKCRTNDSVIINFEKKKIEKCIPLEEKSNALVFAGKHSGKAGIIKNLDRNSHIATVEMGGREVSVLIKQIIAVE